MAAHSRKSALKRVATGEDSHHPTLGVKKVRFVSPDYKTKHTIGRRGTHVVTYNETLLHYGVMANACIEESSIKQKVSEKRYIKKSNKIALKDKVKSYEVKASLKGSVVKDSANDSVLTYETKSSPVNNFKKGSVVKKSGKDCAVKESKSSAKKKIVKRSATNNSVKKSTNSAKRSVVKHSTKGTVAQDCTSLSPVKTSVKTSSIKSSVNHSLKKASMKTTKKFSSKHIVKKSAKLPVLPSIEDNLFELNQGKKLSVCLIRLKREASLNAAAKVNLIYNENQQNSSGKQTRGSGSGNQLKIKDTLILKNCQLFKTSKSYKPAKQSLSSQKDDKVCKSKKNFAINSIRKPNKPFILKTVSGALKKDTFIEKSKLLHNRAKDITTVEKKINQQIQNSSSLYNLHGNESMQKKTKVKSNNSNEDFTKKPKWLNGYECRKDCVACHIETKGYRVDCSDRAKRTCRNRTKCQFSESCMKNYIDNSTLREKNPDCYLQLTNNKQKHFSSQKKLLGKCVKVCQNKDMKVDYSIPEKQLETCLIDYGNLTRYRPDTLRATNDDPLTVVTAQNNCPNSYLKNIMRNHKIDFDNSSTTISLPSNLYGSKGQHQCRSDKEHCCSATTLDFYQTNYNKNSLEVSPGKLSKRMASLNAQAIMDVSQESRYSKREFLQNSQRAARTHYIFSPKRQSCRWVDGLGMFLTNDLQNSTTNDLKQKIIVSCTATSTNGSSVICSNISNTKSSSLTSSNKCSPDIQVQTGIPGRIKQESDKTFEESPKSTSAQFSLFNNVLSSQERQEMVSSCSSFPYIHGNNMSPAQCQTFTLNGIGSISNLSSLPYQPYGSPFNVPCNHGSIPHCSCYSSDNYYPHSSTMVQPIPKPCMITSPIPIHVPHAEVKVLIHNPHPSQPFIQTTADPPKLQKNKRGSQQTIPKNKTADSQQKNNSKKKTDIIKSRRKLGKRNCDLKELLSEKEKNSLPSKRKKLNSSNCGWSWEGEPEMKPVPNLNIDAPPIERKCYPAIKHTDGELIHVRDCVLLRSGPRKKDLPYTAKVVAFWENTTDGEMMMSLLWYYRPEHTESGRQPHNIDCEVFASKHRDINSVACIEEKCYVLTFNEYCRYKAEVRRSESNFPARRKVVPASENYLRQNRLPPIDADPETVFLCRKVYHFRQKRILKN